jgi:hypothetical protein
MKKQKGKKDLKLLSFGDEMEIDKVSGIKSSHDVVSSNSLSKSVDEKVKELATNGDAASRVPPKDNTHIESEVTTSSIEEEAVESAGLKSPRPASTPVVNSAFKNAIQHRKGRMRVRNIIKLTWWKHDLRGLKARSPRTSANEKKILWRNCLPSKVR